MAIGGLATEERTFPHAARGEVHYRPDSTCRKSHLCPPAGRPPRRGVPALRGREPDWPCVFPDIRALAITAAPMLVPPAGGRWRPQRHSQPPPAARNAPARFPDCY